MIAKLESYFRRMRRRISRNELSSKLLGLSSEQGTATDPGLLMIQIDGLSRRQLERAMAARKMPFLRALIKRDKYRLHTHYSGLPSSTPAVQAELFYGVKSAVPAFSYYDRERAEVVRMYVQEAGVRLEEELQEQGEPLLKGGSSYSNIYTGGAAESHFCTPDLGWGPAKTSTRWRTLAVIALNAFGLVRMLGLLVVEFFLAWVDFFRGIAQGESLWKELKFIPARVGVSIMLREFIVAGASIDLARGLPVVHLNFLGYDEQAHRRGPRSAFAHWTLLGIDGAIRRLYSAAARSHSRDYAVWIYSDHGQEETRGFEREMGRPLREVMEEVFEQPPSWVWSRQSEERGLQEARAHWSDLRRSRRRPASEDRLPHVPPTESIVITSMGPIGHVYDLSGESAGSRRRYAEEMVARGIPLVLYRNDAGEVEAVSAEGLFSLPRDGAALFGPSHPALADVAHDLAEVVRHRHAGDFVISGWRRARRMISFPDENGAHAGPGRAEVIGFLLLPAGTQIQSSTRSGVYRPTDLREAALHHLKRKPFAPMIYLPAEPRPSRLLRVMTYNVHGCVGVDAKLSPARIARVIARHQPDVVALQEIDVGRARSGSVDQAQIIADLLRMKFHFYPAFEIGDEKYGLAVLSHFPMRVVKSGKLPGLPELPGLEPRGAQWLEMECDGHGVQIVNTHFGLRTRERRQQVAAILGEKWLGQLGEDDPLIICGDLNALPSSFVHREICTRFRDVQTIVAEHRPMRTLYGRYPLGRIDHIFISSHFEAHRVEVPRTTLTRVASDHLPLFTELKIRPSHAPRATPAGGTLDDRLTNRGGDRNRNARSRHPSA